MSEENTNRVRSSTITKDTLLPISLIISVISVIFVFATMYVQGNANAKQLEEYTKQLFSINGRLSRIEGTLKIRAPEDQ